MLFPSLAFAIFLPLVFALYWWAGRWGRRWQNLLMLAASYYFYASWDPRFLALIILSSLTDYWVGLRLDASREPSRRKGWLYLSLGVNLGMLGCFKYFNFFVGSFVALGEKLGFTMSFTPWEIILPVGISFYTFQTLSYTIDIYRGHLSPTRDLVSFLGFVAFFPQLVAGPIERAKDLLPQFLADRRFSAAEASLGLQQFFWGLFKKIVIADQLVRWVDPIYAQVELYQGPVLVLAGLGFGLIAYCDFSGYSDMAIGIARLFGFRLSLNFAAPFFSTSIREFWSRWHITLMSWFRDYIYFPLGGSRRGRWYWARNILIVFGISGLWHGAAFTYIAFGLVHGLMYIVEQQSNRLLPAKTRLPRWWHGCSTFVWVSLAWFFFRAQSMADVLYIFSHLGEGWTQLPLTPESWPPGVGQRVSILASIGLFVMLETFMQRGDPLSLFGRLTRGWRWALYYFLTLWLLIFGAYGEIKAFIYFQF